MAPLDEAFVRLLACPITRSPLVLSGEWLYSTDRAEPRRYPIHDGVPNLLAEAAESVSADEFASVMTQAGREATKPDTPDTK